MVKAPNRIPKATHFPFTKPVHQRRPEPKRKKPTPTLEVLYSKSDPHLPLPDSTWRHATQLFSCFGYAEFASTTSSSDDDDGNPR